MSPEALRGHLRTAGMDFFRELSIEQTYSNLELFLLIGHIQCIVSIPTKVNTILMVMLNREVF